MKSSLLVCFLLICLGCVSADVSPRLLAAEAKLGDLSGRVGTVEADIGTLSGRIGTVESDVSAALTIGGSNDNVTTWLLVVVPPTVGGALLYVGVFRPLRLWLERRRVAGG